jgi:hypothetical protein
MFRSVVTVVAILAAGLPFGLALAQDKPVSVFFQPCEDQQLNNAITAAMSSQGFVQAMKPAPGVLTVTIPDKVGVTKGRISGTSWAFTVAFSRDGVSLGHAEESCNERKITDCTDQLMSDIKSAAGER